MVPDFVKLTAGRIASADFSSSDAVAYRVQYRGRWVVVYQEVASGRWMKVAL